MSIPGSPARSFFLGQIDDGAVFPFPQLDGDEHVKVSKLVSELRAYCASHYDPHKVEADRWIPDEVLRDLGEMGIMGLYVPERYGGQGLSQTGYSQVFDAIGGVDATLSVVLGSHQSIGYKGIHLFGTQEQKERFLPDLATGRKLAAFALTEAEAGSDAYNVQCRARLQPDGSYRLDGEKRYIGNGSRADVLTVFARTDGGRHVALLVESSMDGFEVGQRYGTMGLAGNDLRHLHFNDVRVPPENVLGEEGDGFRVATQVLNIGRMSLGSGSAGSVRRLMSLALEHTEQRHQFDQPLAEFELVQQKVAWMATYLYGMEAMSYLTTGLVDRGVTDFRLESAVLKVAGTEFLWYAANRVFQLAGGQAYMTDQPYEKMLRDIRVFPIFEGANDVMRLFVALDGLKTLGDELEGLMSLSPRRPVRSATAVAAYATGRVQRTFSPDQLSGVHPAFATRAKAVAGQVRDLRGAAEGLVRKHGTGVTEQQAQLKRIAHAAIDIYAQVAALARASRALHTLPAGAAADDEQFVADTFCRRAENRTERWLRQMDHNDDERMRAVARAAYDRRSYSGQP